RREEVVDDDVIDEFRTHRAGKAEKIDLDRGRAERQDPRSRVLAGVAGQIDEDVDPVGVDTLGRRGIVDRGQIDKAVERRDEAMANIAAVIRTVTIAADAKARPIVPLY